MPGAMLAAVRQESQARQALAARHLARFDYRAMEGFHLWLRCRPPGARWSWSSSTSSTRRSGWELLKNNEKIRIVRYAYAEGAGTSRYPGVIPARATVFSTFGDLLVGEEFVSSFQEDATEFDKTKVPAIIKGKSTRAEVLSLLGKPNGKAIYPLIKSKADTAVTYSYSHAKGSVSNTKFYRKGLVISFDANGVVTDVDYSFSEEK